jgi:predicted porin
MTTIKKSMKTISTAAVLGATLGMASTAALAQTNVTVFGQIALGMTKASGGALSLQTTGWGNGIGFKGSEDLGGGLSAIFHIENRFDADTGAAATPFWAEKTAVGLAGGFGKVELGRFGNAFDAILGIADVFGETVANMPHENALGETKWANSIGYATPMFGPVSAAFTVSTKEAPNVHAAYSFNLKYADGPATVGLGYVRNGANDIKSVSLAGNYDFGAAKLYGGYTNSSDTGTGDARNYQVGIGIPVSAVGTVKAAFSNYKPDTNLDSRENKIGLGYWHNLSKRTMLYADAARTNLRVVGVERDVNAVDVGIFHRF